ncbi:MAG: aminotransferase class III-fold pyridoxal phosphate-dependent enzyme [Gemmobacter sp.]|nr:aminotransferase class III-fold pyridoxal phosphate-dependent enzyme [Gemmobacter sp.]
MRPTKRDGNLLERARAVIPGGMYGHQSTARMPEGTPQFFGRSHGTRVWDADGNCYIDMMSAYGPNLLGYGHAGIDAVIREQMALGDTMTGPGPVMVDLAEALVGMIGHADWAMFCKNGADATSMAMVTARAHTGRRKVLIAKGAYHGAAPWNTPRPAGTLPEDRAHIVYFEYNDLQSLTDAARAVQGDLAAVFATPFRHDTFADQSVLDPDYARGVRAICDAHDAVLVVDEVRAGFRLSRDCTWDSIGVQPDLSAWGKVLGNGQPISALLGKEHLRAAASEIFVTGSFWFSAVPMVAALETLRLVRETDYLEKLTETGTYLRDALAKQAQSHGFGLRQTGPATMPMILFEEDPDFRFGYHWCRIAMKNGLWLSPYHNMFINGAMTLADMDEALEKTEIAFLDLKKNRANVPPVAALMPKAQLAIK